MLTALRRARARRRSLAVCAIATRDFLPWAQVLFTSIAEHHPEARRVLLYVTRAGEPRETPQLEGIEVITPEMLVGTEIEAALRRRFDIPELCFSLKPSLMRRCLDAGAERALYLDTDIDVVAPLDSALLALEDADVVLTPHLDAPIPMDRRSPSDLVILRAGVFNLGFAGVAATPGAREVLDWWLGRVMQWGYVSPQHGYQGDQKWMDLAMVMFPGVAILRDAGSNVAYWNLHSRKLTEVDGRLMANGRPLSFLHWSGFDPEHPGTLSRYQSRIQEGDQPALMARAAHFARRIQGARAAIDSISWETRPHETQVAEPPTSHEGPYPAEAFRGRIEAAYFEPRVETFERVSATIRITNQSAHAWRVAASPTGQGPVQLSYHVLRADGSIYQWEHERVTLGSDLEAGAAAEVLISPRAPSEPGRYLLQFDLVRDGDAWFSQRGVECVMHPLDVGII